MRALCFGGSGAAQAGKPNEGYLMGKLIEAVTADADVDDAGVSGDEAQESGAETSEEGEGSEAEEGGESEDEEGEKPEKDEPKGKKEAWTPEMQKAFDKRIGKWTAEKKALEERAKSSEEEIKGLRERTDAEDSEVVLLAAREAGVMPELLGTAEAKGLADLSYVRGNARALSEALEDQEGDEITVAGETYSRADVKKSLRVWKEKQEALEKRFGRTEAQAREKGLEVWKLGLAARKAGWKPGQKPAAAEKEADADEGGKAKAEQAERKPKPKADFPDGGGGGGGAPKGKGGAVIEVKSTNDLAAWIQNKEQKRK